MSDQQRLDAFLKRLEADPDLSAIAVLLGPYKAMMRDPSAVVQVIESVVAHWHATQEVAA